MIIPTPSIILGKVYYIIWVKLSAESKITFRQENFTVVKVKFQNHQNVDLVIFTVGVNLLTNRINAISNPVSYKQNGHP